MPHTMHTIQDTESATHLAQQLLDTGRSVSLIARDTSHFAMLVNEYGDRFQTIPLSWHTIRNIQEAFAYAESMHSQGDVLIIVSE